MSVRQLQANDGLTSASTECSSWQAMFFMTNRLSGLTIECILRSISTGFFQTLISGQGCRSHHECNRDFSPTIPKWTVKHPRSVAGQHVRSDPEWFQ
jgi:hypothetical protein